MAGRMVLDGQHADLPAHRFADLDRTSAVHATPHARVVDFRDVIGDARAQRVTPGAVGLVIEIGATRPRPNWFSRIAPTAPAVMR